MSTKVHGRQLLRLGFSTIYNQNYLRLHFLDVNKSKTYSPHNNTIRKLYVSKMNENKEIIPTKYTRNPPDHRRQITIIAPPQTLLPDFIRWSHSILMVPVLLAHMFVLSMICQI